MDMLNWIRWIAGTMVTRTHGFLWSRGVGVPGMWSRSVGDVTVVVVVTVVVAPSSLRSAINRALQFLSLVISSSLFALKIFAHPLNCYALMYYSCNVIVIETVSRLSSSSLRRSLLNYEPYAFRSNLTVLQNSAGQRISGDVIDVQPVGNINVVSDVRRGVILKI